MSLRRLLVLGLAASTSLASCVATPTPTPSPTQAPPPDTAWVQLSGVHHYICARRQSGEVRCWGDPYVYPDHEGPDPPTSPELPDLPEGAYRHVVVRSAPAVCGLTLAGSELRCGFSASKYVGGGGFAGYEALTPEDLPAGPVRDLDLWGAGLLLWLDDAGRPHCVGDLCRGVRPLPTDQELATVRVSSGLPNFVVARRADGTAISWGDDPVPIDHPQTRYREIIPTVRSLASAAYGLTIDGRVELVGAATPSATWPASRPPEWEGVAAISGRLSLTALWSDGHLEHWDSTSDKPFPVDPDVYFDLPALGRSLPADTRLRSILDVDGVLCGITDSWGVWCSVIDEHHHDDAWHLPWTTVPADLLPPEVNLEGR